MKAFGPNEQMVIAVVDVYVNRTITANIRTIFNKKAGISAAASAICFTIYRLAEQTDHIFEILLHASYARDVTEEEGNIVIYTEATDP